MVTVFKAFRRVIGKLQFNCLRMSMSEVVLSGFGRRDHTRSGNKKNTNQQRLPHQQISAADRPTSLRREGGLLLCVRQGHGNLQNSTHDLERGERGVLLGFFLRFRASGCLVNPLTVFWWDELGRLGGFWGGGVGVLARELRHMGTRFLPSYGSLWSSQGRTFLNHPNP